MRAADSKYGFGPAGEKCFAWANDYPLRKQPKESKPRKPKGGPAAAEARLSRLDELIKSWQRKKKTAETYIAKYTREQKRINKRVSKCPQKSEA